MKLEKAIKKIEKALGVKVECPTDGRGRYYFQHGNKIGSFLSQAVYGTREDGTYGPIEGEWEACNWHVRREGDVSDPHTDYFAGYFLDNCSQLVRTLKPPTPKYSIGCLVRGKQNKRATRQGYAGKTGMVIQAGEYMKIQWLDYKPGYDYLTYPQRDLELVSGV
jgi:hypothetical protein